MTGNSGVGKSTVCELLKARGEAAIDADWEGYNHWVDRTSGRVVVDSPDLVPAGWPQPDPTEHHPVHHHALT
ncbi:hypothetical protein [Kitasatospora sp. MAP5-34]|uniref:hypothetical protein n=1 Tax=Kitasatospora sp. MAP5-34 TaxID=3035102 RepID=UPI0024749A69|nr:hypothetical protein [Kitasatospora sp. MAP5-34]